MKPFQRIKTLIAVSLLSAQIAAPIASARTQVIELPPGEDATVIRIIDGDTVEVRVANKRFSVRYIGINTPEMNRKPLQCFAKEAQIFNKQLVLNKPVRLEKDINETDKFGRLLRYVYLQDGRMVNAELVKSGYALATTYPPDVKYAEQLAALQTQAREAGAGLWTKCAQVQAAPIATPASVQAAAQPLVPAQPAPAAVSSSAQPLDPWTCPDSHPIKGNYGKKAKIYHVPGGRYYKQTKPEKCFATAAAAVTDGFRAPLK